MSDKHKTDKESDTDLQEPSRFINRELSWLAFNQRVMEEATNRNNPLLERVKFLSISALNLDEFTMVRVAGLKDQVHHHMDKVSDDGLTPGEQLEFIQKQAVELMQAQQDCWLQLRMELADADIHVVHVEELTEEDERWLQAHFLENIFPALTPIAVDPAHPFPFLPNQGIAMLFELRQVKSGRNHIAVLTFPQKLQRLIRLGGREERFILLEDVITLFLDMLFPGSEKIDSELYRIIRDSDLEVEEEAEDLMHYYEKAVKQRRRGRVIRIKALTPISEKLLAFFTEHMEADPRDIIEVDGMVGLADLSELYNCQRPDLKYEPYEVRFPERISDYGGDCFAAIQAKDIIVHHPYESFDVVVQFLYQAARDPNVVSIKQTLYRTSQDSPIIGALIEAAENGKSVTALVELKARFDEEANIKWARDLERVGVQVVYGFVRLKTHAKISLVTRLENNRLRTYAHFGTGNYHPMTAKVYTDLSYFTCNAALCRDAAHLFNFITGYSEPKNYEKVIAAPNHMRKQLLQLIDDEIAFAKDGKPAALWAKMNSLVDPEIIDKLYEASTAGVNIQLIIRGICCLRPGVPGMSENIHVKSIVGRFLEHSRIFCFGAGKGLPSPDAKVYISSADWMPRNLNWRVEVMVPIENSTVHAQVLDQIMVANLKDDRQTWHLMPSGKYLRDDMDGEFSAHEYFMNNPSLSGRGKALRKNKKQLMRLVSSKPNGKKSGNNKKK